VRVLAGELTSSFYSSRATLDTIRTVKERNPDLEIEIVHGPDADPETQRKLLDLGVKLYKLPRRPQGHFTVVDGRHCKVEEFHVPSETVREYYIKKNSKRMGRSLEIKYDAIKQRAVPVTIEELGSGVAAPAERCDGAHRELC